MTILATLSNGTDTFGFRESQVLAIETNQPRQVAELETIRGKSRSQLLGYGLKTAEIRARFHRDDFSNPPTSPDSQLAGLQFLYDMEDGVFELKIGTKSLGNYVFENLEIAYTKINGSITVATDVRVQLTEHFVAP
ncbi:MAG: hypothetical protein F6K31_03220 [Symploca sp. SIO2G7]|nr:hypothetical protein [Symploca sp. SIO2G7]